MCAVVSSYRVRGNGAEIGLGWLGIVFSTNLCYGVDGVGGCLYDDCHRVHK